MLKKTNFGILLASVLFVASSVSHPQSDEVVASEGELSITANAYRYMVANAPKELKENLLVEDEARYELIASTLASKKVLRKLQQVSPETSPVLYQRFLFAVLAAAKEVDEAEFQRNLSIPNLEGVAKERYRVSKEQIARKPELRELSHILLLCQEECDEEDKTATLYELRNRILAGESFADLAAQHSQDPGSRQRGGRLREAVALQNSNIDITFRKTAFDLIQVGDISDVVKSRFGFHIIKLENITPSRLYTYEEVKEPLLAEVERRFREDAYRQYWLSLAPGGELVIDHDALDALAKEALGK